VKLLVEEAGSAKLFDVAETVPRATSVIAYAESCAALAMAGRTARLTAAGVAAALKELDDLWPTLRRIAVTEQLVNQAGSLALSHELRGYDAVHLAAALTMGMIDSVTVATWDRQLSLAADAHGLAVFPASLP
jgi:predicted nucleic acid-binding protein